ncbi:MAG: hypothetical protein U5K54_26270 [Cytophagales bacterium]|nr:hypothetical protein [Cytophagales bacterium]
MASHYSSWDELCILRIRIPFVTSIKTNRVIAILLSIVIHFAVFMIGLYAWRVLGMIASIYRALYEHL